jgi:hypothetical protein
MARLAAAGRRTMGDRHAVLLRTGLTRTGAVDRSVARVDRSRGSHSCPIHVGQILLHRPQSDCIGHHWYLFTNPKSHLCFGNDLPGGRSSHCQSTSIAAGRSDRPYSNAGYPRTSRSSGPGSKVRRRLSRISQTHLVLARTSTDSLLSFQR